MTGTQIAYYFLCHRKLWFSSNHIELEQFDENVALGKFISESTYERQKHEIKIDDIVLDFYDSKNKVIHEIKKSDKMEEIHVWQVKHYILVLENKGVLGVTGVIDYPKLRQKVEVVLTDYDREKLIEIEGEIINIINLTCPPNTIDKPFCKKCAYFDLCFI
ncbi:MAG: CRISPR-associated protein Cas4 [Melioribacteraceae bacterium]|nr:CRISPR-associated protein Cas4 [Melioribacteraceae bacterium]